MSRGGGGHRGFGAFRFSDGGNQGLKDGNEAVVNGAEVVDDCYGSPYGGFGGAYHPYRPSACSPCR